jgi:hypothetical protein
LYGVGHNTNTPQQHTNTTYTPQLFVATNTTQTKGAYVDADADPEAVAADLEGRMAAVAALAGAAQAHDECLALLGQPAADPGPLLAAEKATAARHEVRALFVRRRCFLATGF